RFICVWHIKSYLILRSPHKRVSRRTRHPWSGILLPSVRDPAERADLGEFAAQLLPAVAGVVAGEEFAVMAAGDDEAGVGSVRRELPDRRIGLGRQGERLPTLAAVARALDRPGIAGCAVPGGAEQRFRVVGFLRQVAAIAQAELVADKE